MLLATAACLGACTSTYRDLDYAPEPALAIVQPVGTDAALARVLMSVQGIRYDREEGYWLLVRMRVENRSPEPIDLFTAELLLVESTLEPFGTPRVLDQTGNPTPPTVPARGVGTFDLLFPFPEETEDLDLNSLNLKWGLLHPGGEEVLSTTFERLVGGDSGWGIYPGLSIGVGFD